MERHSTLNHIAVMAAPAVDAIEPWRDGGYIDATFGGGGHSSHLLERMSPASRLLALDCDEYAEARAAEVTDDRFSFMRCNFADMADVAAESGITEVQGVLFDLGMSSLQTDSDERGLSFMRNGPLDMRFDRRLPETAQSWLATANEREIVRVLKEYGEEPEARRLGRALVARRGHITDTATLAKIVADYKRRHPPGRHPATLVFQALRMVVNRELESLRRGLSAACRLLAAGGRLVVIAFHSIEDRTVKRALLPPSFPGFGRVSNGGMRQIGKALSPSEEEVAANPRARSAKLRVFVKEATV